MELRGRDPTKEGVTDLFRMQIAAFPDLVMATEDVIDGYICSRCDREYVM